MILAAASSAGTSSYNGDGPPAGFVDNLTFGFPTAPLGAVFTLTIANIVVASWIGPTPWGPLLIANSETVQIAASGLSPGVGYAGIMAGSRHPADEVPASAPQFGPATVAVVNLTSTSLLTSAAFSTGTGADGAVVLTSGASLTRNMNYSSLTVNPGVLLATAGYIIFCTGTVTCNGQIDNSGTAGGLDTAGTGGLTGGSLFGGGAGSLPGNPNGGVKGSSPPGGTCQGGGGGGGGAASGFNAYGGTTVPSPPGGVSLAGIITNSYGGGAGGGGATSSTPQYCGGGGGGGGVVMIFCNALAGNGTITANGGAGGAGNASGYGGGGGGGGVALVACSASTFTGTVLANGGAGGVNVNQSGQAGFGGTAVLIA